MLQYLYIVGLGLCLIAAAQCQQTFQPRARQVWFERDNNRYTFLRQRERDGVVRMDIPEQGDTDSAVVLHDTVRRLTIYKDLSIGACFLTPLALTILYSRGLIVRYQTPSDRNSTKFDYSIFPYGIPLKHLEEITGTKGAELCEGYPTWRAELTRRDGRSDDGSSKGRRQKRWSWSASSAVSINRDGSIERCFKTSNAEPAATECTAGQATSQAEASSNSTDTQPKVEEDNTKSGGVWSFLKSLFRRSKRSTDAVSRHKRWSFSSSSSVSVGSDGKVQRCSQTNTGESSSSRCDTGDASSSASASSGKNGTASEETEEDGQSLWDWLFGRD